VASRHPALQLGNQAAFDTPLLAADFEESSSFHCRGNAAALFVVRRDEQARFVPRFHIYGDVDEPEHTRTNLIFPGKYPDVPGQRNLGLGAEETACARSKCGAWEFTSRPPVRSPHRRPQQGRGISIPSALGACGM
jgi:hypothetical protein